MAVQRRKPDKTRKEAHLRVRLSPAHMNELKAAAEHAGITLSAWVTERLLQCARQEKRQANSTT